MFTYVFMEAYSNKHKRKKLGFLREEIIKPSDITWRKKNPKVNEKEPNIKGKEKKVLLFGTITN